MNTYTFLPFQVNLLVRAIEKNRKTGNEIATSGYLSGAEQDGHHDEGYQLSLRETAVHDQRVSELERMFGNKLIVEPINQEEVVLIGNGVSVQFKGGEEMHFILVAHIFEPYSGGLISLSSPLGKAILGKKTGDTVRVGNGQEISIQKITNPSEASSVWLTNTR